MESQSSELRSEFADELRVLGVDCKGFGVIPKAVMTDPDLTAQAKAIYAYFASYTGAGTTAFPSREKIIYDLDINKSTFYKHFQLLLDNGYITVEQPHGRGEEGHSGFCRNIYTLVQNPAKFSAPAETGAAVLRASGLKASGYGTIPKSVMIDRRIDLKAKALYAYLAAFAGAGRVACPSQQDAAFHLNLSHNTFAKCLLALREYNYISVMQRRSESGQVGCNDYVLNDNPDLDEAITGHVFSAVPEKATSAPYTKISDTQSEPSTRKPYTQKPYTQKPYTKKPYTQNSDTNNNSLYNQQTQNKQSQNTIFNVVDDIHPSVLPACEDGRTDAAPDAKKENRAFIASSSEAIREIIKSEGKIPFELTKDEKTRTALVRQITEWNFLCDKSNYAEDQSFDFEAYRLAAETISGMLHPAFSRKIDGRYVTSASVLERVNRYLDPQLCVISDYIRAAARNYIQATFASTIKQPVRYMETCLWTVLQEGDIRAEAECAELSALLAASRKQTKNPFFDMVESGTDYDALAREAQRKSFAKMDEED